jgi:hypothetical protein
MLPLIDHLLHENNRHTPVLRVLNQVRQDLSRQAKATSVMLSEPKRQPLGFCSSRDSLNTFALPNGLEWLSNHLKDNQRGITNKVDISEISDLRHVSHKNIMNL